MADRVVSYVLEQKLGVDVVIVGILYLDDRSRNFREQDPDAFGLAVGVHDAADVDVGSNVPGTHQFQCRKQASVADCGGGEQDAILHELADNLMAVNEIVGVSDFGVLVSVLTESVA